jgi:23S rRNA (cytidine1920-2'-O)/16S rRNA (cytidine1409-2'-O)-methyltransferase
LSGLVFVDGQRADKAGARVRDGQLVEVKGPSSPYVGRGGEKLEGALEKFGIDVEGLVAIDVGASTGGFTDCLLQHGAAKVYAVDVGYGQLAWKLQSDTRVVRLDRVNIRTAPADLLPELCDIAVIDVSFISLKLVLPPVTAFLKDVATLAVLVKPQFEVGRGKVGKGGIVRDPELQRGSLLDVADFAAGAGLGIAGWTESPLKGADGNREFFLHLIKGGSGEPREEIARQIAAWQPA